MKQWCEQCGTWTIWGSKASGIDFCNRCNPLARNYDLVFILSEDDLVTLLKLAARGYIEFDNAAVLSPQESGAAFILLNKLEHELERVRNANKL